MPKRAKSREDFVAECRKVHGTVYQYATLPDYVPALSVIQITCKKHGNFKQVASDHKRAAVPCPKCRAEQRTQSKTLEQFIKDARAVHGQLYVYLKTKYKNNKTKCQITCCKHGDFEQTPAAHLAGQGCPKCATEKSQERILPFAVFVRKARSVHGNRYEYDKNSWRGSAEFVTITCQAHGVFQQRGHNHLAGTGCPVCGTVATVKNRPINVVTTSKIEKAVAKWLSSFVRVQTKHVLSDGKEVDIVLPDQRIGIEVNGLYWHASKPKTYHMQKSQLAKTEGLQLYHLWEHWLVEKAAIVKSMLRVRLGFARHRVFARETTVRVLDTRTEREFFDRNHLQGWVASRVCYGVFLQDQLVLAMSFGKARFDRSHQWEILRLSAARNTVVVGGPSKAFAAFVRENAPESVCTYADLDYGTGAVYEKLGFKFTHVTAPNYFWIKGRVALPRYKTQKHKLRKLLSNFDPQLSEAQNMEAEGFRRIYNSGNAVFTWVPDHA